MGVPPLMLHSFVFTAAKTGLATGTVSHANFYYGLLYNTTVTKSLNFYKPSLNFSYLRVDSITIIKYLLVIINNNVGSVSGQLHDAIHHFLQVLRWINLSGTMALN